MRQIVIDTETTGLEPERGHRVIEVGAVEIVDRRITGEHLQLYLDPERDIDDAAFDVHGIDRAFLAGKPKFAEVAQRFLDFVDGAEIIMHNAPFDVSFIDYELSLLGAPRRLGDSCRITDSLALARAKHPGQKNGLDALCRRYQVDNSARERHGALLDAEILAEVYLAMTGGQTTLFGESQATSLTDQDGALRLPAQRPETPVVRATAEELRSHERFLDALDAASGDGSVWRRLGKV